MLLVTTVLQYSSQRSRYREAGAGGTQTVVFNYTRFPYGLS